jgi:hypothetical protein
MVALVMFWVLLNLYTGHQHSWVALLAALDIGWILRFGGWRAGWRRGALGLAATASVVAIANWSIIAANLGGMLGLSPLPSALKLGFHHAWILTQMANGPWDVAWIALALLIALLASR